jgi:hypothetical protein
MTSLVVPGIALAGYCLDYQTHEAYRVRDQLFEPGLFGSSPFVASPVLIKFGEAIIEPGSVPHVAVSGLYPRGSMTSNEAVIGGLLAPFLLLVAAGYLGLGASSRAGSGRGAGAPASAPADATPPGRQLANQKAEQSTSSPAVDPSEITFRVAIGSSGDLPRFVRAGLALADAVEPPEIPKMALRALGAQSVCQCPGRAPLALGQGT